MAVKSTEGWQQVTNQIVLFRHYITAIFMLKNTAATAVATAAATTATIGSTGVNYDRRAFLHATGERIRIRSARN